MIKKYLQHSALGLSLAFGSLCASEAYDPLAPQGHSGINLDLRNPEFSDGSLTTCYGGIISGDDFRIQAQNITYTYNKDSDPPSYGIIAEGNLMFEYGDYVFIGERMEYDFKSRVGVIYNGRTMVEPWFFAGSRIFILPDGSYKIENVVVTTSENIDADWQITSDFATLDDEYELHAKDVKFTILGTPVFYLPSFKINLDTIFDGPIRYSVRWGGNQGHRFGMIYEVYSNEWFKTFLRLDYRINRGIGGGIETYYRSEDKKTQFESISYAARDSSIIHPDQRFRYRLQGIGDSSLLDDSVTVHLSYDKLSDIDMATDYADNGLEIDAAGRTELIVRKQEENWITNIFTRLRINQFQTIKQELPTFETSWRPTELGETGIVASSVLKAAYLDFAYGNNMINVRDYNSTRVEVAPQFYRPFLLETCTVTPEAGGILIAYGNSPTGSTEWLTLAKLGLNINTSLYRHFNDYKHVITPFAQYDYYSMPTVSPGSHYIFDIEDGWYRLNMMQFGISQSLYKKDEYGINRIVYGNLYANAFFDTHTFPSTIPKVYADVTLNAWANLRHTFNTAWDFNNNILDHYNVRTEWTINPDAALAFEYRHRSAYDWRKVDHTNFILDTYRSLQELYNSQVSDRRDTFLIHMFYRFHPCWAFEFESRSGWNRRFEPNYNEFEIDLLGTLQSAWNIKFSYQHKEDDDRVSAYVSIGIKRPDCFGPRKITPSPRF